MQYTDSILLGDDLYANKIPGGTVIHDEDGVEFIVIVNNQSTIDAHIDGCVFRVDNGDVYHCSKMRYPVGVLVE